MQTSYPVFESGQVLTSSHLNGLVDYLEHQDRLTRNKLIGIGIVCGLEVGYEAQDNRIRVTGGCAVTSEGYLLVQEEALLNQFRQYTLPVPQLEEAPEDLLESTSYPFFFDEDGNQIPLWELLPTDYTPNPGEPTPTKINAGFLKDKVVLLYLECNLESLKNCDINDCSDKGAEMDFAVRILLATVDDAKAMLEQEEKIAQRPVDLHNHPRYNLKELRIEKINPAAHGIDNFAALFSRILAVANALGPAVVDGLKASYAAYKYLLEDVYPVTQFPSGPFGGPSYFNNVLAQLSQNIFLVQYFYAYWCDLVQSYNEFLRAAIRLEAECCPNPDRFPKHILLGLVAERPTALGVDLSQPAGFDPLKANSGLGPSAKPAPFRHHFIPSMLFDRQHTRLLEVRALHYRLYLLALRYATNDLLNKEIRITPSKEGDYLLTDKAIPFYYAFGQGDDLHRNWSFRKTVTNRLAQLYSYQFITTADHPLKYTMADHNFYRIEGIVGKGLGTVMKDLLQQKQQLGLSFAIEPVYLGLKTENDLTSGALDKEAMLRAQQALLKLLLCRMRDLDVVFLVLMATLFSYLVAIIALLSRTNTSVLAGLAAGAIGREAEPNLENIRLIRLGALHTAVLTQIDRKNAASLLKEIRPVTYTKGTITAKVSTGDDPKVSLGKLYSQITTSPVTPANLFDRTLEFARQIGPNADPQVVARKIYPSVSLLDKAEELVEVVSAPSLADFNFQQFEAKYDGFVQAFQVYMAHTDQEPSETDPQLAATQATLSASFGAIAATTPQSIVGNLASEVTERLNNIFSELLLGTYAKRHPGMEHKGGVPVGGTLSLLFTHRNFVRQVMRQNQATLDTKVKAVHAKYVSITAASAIKNPDEALVAVSESAEPLNDFVVLADFCVPYLCCDSDCSDINLESEPPPPPPP